MKTVLTMLFVSTAVFAQVASAPLEAVKIQHTVVSPEVVQQLAGIKIGQSIDQDVLTDFCNKLGKTGLFTNVQYRYSPGPKHGQILTLDLQDETDLTPAVIDVPLVDEAQVWQWLAARFPTLQHQILKSDEGQEFIAKEIGVHLSSALDGERIVAHQESDLVTRRSLTVLQPENLPQMSSLDFTGVQELTSSQLATIIHDSMKTLGYSEYTLRQYLEGGVRQAYEEHGMYRVQFPKITAKRSGKLSVAVTAEVVEGPQFTLNSVRAPGAGEAESSMFKAANFQIGAIANWRDIQQSIVKTHKPLLRLGYQESTIVPRRVLDDEKRQLELELEVRLGPLYHFGQVSFSGLAADLDAKAHKLWKMAPGDIYDSFYVYDFARDFFTATGLRDVTLATKTQSDEAHVTNLIVSFARKNK